MGAYWSGTPEVQRGWCPGGSLRCEKPIRCNRLVVPVGLEDQEGLEDLGTQILKNISFNSNIHQICKIRKMVISGATPMR